MAQTTTGLPQGIGLASLSTNGSTWVDSSGSITKITHSPGAQLIGTSHTLGGERMIAKGSGKVEVTKTTIVSVWTVTATETWDQMFTEWDTAGPKEYYFKYSPQGGGSGDLEFIAADDAGSAVACPIETFKFPEQDVVGELIMIEFTLVVPGYVDATIA